MMEENASTRKNVAEVLRVRQQTATVWWFHRVTTVYSWW